MSEIGANVRRIQERLWKAAQRSGRRADEVKLVAATKNVSVPAIREALAAGVNAIGENRVQEALKKVAQLGREAEWHFIGHLQTNKARYLVEWVDLLHSLDRWGLAVELEKLGAGTGKVWEVLIQVNLASEASKSGLAGQEVRPFLEKVANLAHIRVRGLMTIGPWAVESEEVRPVFRQMRRLAEEIAGEGWPGIHMDHLSMGMSNDFEVAVEEGATMIRVGTAVFGERSYGTAD